MGVVTAKPGFTPVLIAVFRVLGADVFEVVKAAHNHFATGSGTVMLEHLEQRLEKQFEIGVSEIGFFRKGGRDVAFSGVKSVGDDVFSALDACLSGN